MTRPRSGLSSLKARLDDLVAGARQAFLEAGNHPVTACIYLPGGTPLRFEAPSGSPENLAIVRQLFEMAAREACAVVTEGWSVEGVERSDLPAVVALIDVLLRLGVKLEQERY